MISIDVEGNNDPFYCTYNYFMLMKGETRNIELILKNPSDLKSKAVIINGWNTNREVLEKVFN